MSAEGGQLAVRRGPIWRSTPSPGALGTGGLVRPFRREEIGADCELRTSEREGSV